MDATEDMTVPEPEPEPRAPNAALRLLITSLRAQVELSLEIEAAHMEELRDHSFTRQRLNSVTQDRERIMTDQMALKDKMHQVRRAIAGYPIRHTALDPDGDLLAEAQELFAKCYDMESDLFAARTLLEKVDAPNENWGMVREAWANRVKPMLDKVSLEVEPFAATDEHMPDIKSAREVEEAGNGESHS